MNLSVSNVIKYLLFICCLATPAITPAAQLEGVNIDNDIRLSNGARLSLNGAGIRTKFFFDIYIGALYLTEKANNLQQVLAMKGEKRVLMHFLYDELSKQKLVDAWNDGFEANLNEKELNELKPKIDTFNSLFTDVKKGDVITLDYYPEKGTQVSINHNVRGEIPGNAFNQALLKIWLGEEPADSDLKDAMLGAPN